MADLYGDYYKLRKADTDAEVPYLPPYLKDVLPKERGCRILDIGCGLGRTLAGLREAGYTDLTGLDLSNKAVDICKKKGLDVIHADVRGYASENASRRFDFIIMSHVLEHLPKEKMTEEVGLIRSRLLGKGGSLFVSVPNAQSNTGCYWAYEDFTHNTLFTAGSLEFVLRSAGFDEVAFVDEDGTAGISPLKKLVKRALLKIYIKNIEFWNRVTSSYYHAPSPHIYTYEIKALARNNVL